MSPDFSTIVFPARRQIFFTPPRTAPGPTFGQQLIFPALFSTARRRRPVFFRFSPFSVFRLFPLFASPCFSPVLSYPVPSRPSPSCRQASLFCLPAAVARSFFDFRPPDPRFAPSSF
jgi:hypothetical protein